MAKLWTRSTLWSVSIIFLILIYSFITSELNTNGQFHNVFNKSQLAQSDEIPDGVFPPDERYLIGDTTVSPYHMIAMVSTDHGGCTGWFAGPDLVVTAGPCLFDLFGAL